MTDLRVYVVISVFFFFFNDTATTEIYTLSLHDALPICWRWRSSVTSCRRGSGPGTRACSWPSSARPACSARSSAASSPGRSEEHTSELQSRQYLVCRLLLEKKKKLRIKVRRYQH